MKIGTLLTMEYNNSKTGYTIIRYCFENSICMSRTFLSIYVMLLVKLLHRTNLRKNKFIVLDCKWRD